MELKIRRHSSVAIDVEKYCCPRFSNLVLMSTLQESSVDVHPAIIQDLYLTYIVSIK